ncbi:MAG: hypothetical protein LBC80_06170, partial [Treponema sp.]|nr:hypothetical protein [Treponema sp.]
MKRIASPVMIFLFSCIPFFAMPLFAVDFGLILDESGSISGFGGEGLDLKRAEYTGSLIPRFSALLGDSGEVYVSAGLTLGYESESISFLPELLRTEFNWLFSSCSLKAGRMYYSAP